MYLYLRERSPFWWADVTVGDGDRQRFPTKRRHLFPTGTVDEPRRLTPEQAAAKREAESVVAAFVKERLDASQLGLKPDMTLGEAVERTLLFSQENRDQRGMQKQANKILGRGQFAHRHHLKPDSKLVEVTTTVVETLKAKRLKEGNKPNTVDREVAFLQRVWNLARGEWHVRVNPDVKFRKFKPKGKLRYLSVEEENRLLAELSPTRDIEYSFVPKRSNSKKPVTVTMKYSDLPTRTQQQMQDQYDLAVFLLDTGARYSEVSSITWDAVDTRHWKTINVYRWKVGNEGVLAMTSRLREILKRRWSKRGNHYYVFPGYGEEDEHRGHATKGISKAINRAGLNAGPLVKRYGKVTVHTFRDTFATRLVKRGVSLYKVQKLLGHASPQMTQKYAHLADTDAADEAASVLDQIREEEAA